MVSRGKDPDDVWSNATGTVPIRKINTLILVGGTWKKQGLPATCWTDKAHEGGPTEKSTGQIYIYTFNDYSEVGRRSYRTTGRGRMTGRN